MRFFLIPLVLTLPMTGFAQEVAGNAQPQIVRISDTEVTIGKIHLDQKKRELSFYAGVNMTKGLIEYLLATTKSDKVHETLFLTDVSPLNINIGMKLLGIKESKELFEIIDEKEWKPTGKFPAVTPKVHAASLVNIIVEWGEGDQTKRLPVNELIQHIEWPKEAATPKPNQEVETKEATLSVMEGGPWLSTGSYIHEGRFKAEVGGIIFGIYTNEQAIVNFSGKDRLLGDVWIPHEKILPKEATVVKIIVKPHYPKK
ncbi:MAG: hypothetical protein ACJAVK_000684 [Akkermansiaceae bacterium]|jgi:hypothetical protein